MRIFEAASKLASIRSPSFVVSTTFSMVARPSTKDERKMGGAPTRLRKQRLHTLAASTQHTHTHTNAD